MFFWPELVMQILEKNQVRLAALREKTEDRLRDRLLKYDDKLKDMLKRVEAYRSIGVSFFSEKRFLLNSFLYFCGSFHPKSVAFFQFCS